jgi:hypothetical protein
MDETESELRPEPGFGTIGDKILDYILTEFDFFR